MAPAAVPNVVQQMLTRAADHNSIRGQFADKSAQPFSKQGRDAMKTVRKRNEDIMDFANGTGTTMREHTVIPNVLTGTTRTNELHKTVLNLQDELWDYLQNHDDRKGSLRQAVKKSGTSWDTTTINTAKPYYNDLSNFLIKFFQNKEKREAAAARRLADASTTPAAPPRARTKGKKAAPETILDFNPQYQHPSEYLPHGSDDVDEDEGATPNKRSPFPAMHFGGGGESDDGTPRKRGAAAADLADGSDDAGNSAKKIKTETEVGGDDDAIPPMASFKESGAELAMRVYKLCQNDPVAKADFHREMTRLCDTYDLHDFPKTMCYTPSQRATINKAVRHVQKQMQNASASATSTMAFQTPAVVPADNAAGADAGATLAADQKAAIAARNAAAAKDYQERQAKEAAEMKSSTQHAGATTMDQLLKATPRRSQADDKTETNATTTAEGSGEDKSKTSQNAGDPQATVTSPQHDTPTTPAMGSPEKNAAGPTVKTTQVGEDKTAENKAGEEDNAGATAQTAQDGKDMTAENKAGEKDNAGATVKDAHDGKDMTAETQVKEQGESGATVQTPQGGKETTAESKEGNLGNADTTVETPQVRKDPTAESKEGDLGNADTTVTSQPEHTSSTAQEATGGYTTPSEHSENGEAPMMID
ncbi:uncharacterized protein LTR77_005653 [Saxophila tyrrhenica]|uniref:Uncharacterized protein n=1 Tax=Saxophila tyrrhenica TaxID=1690608 RepID=A0AAV9PDC7_9PEZI|nr:hypothetical protein LTR77_005653 [Saxophila tyrrhenica]